MKNQTSRLSLSLNHRPPFKTSHFLYHSPTINISANFPSLTPKSDSLSKNLSLHLVVFFCSQSNVSNLSDGNQNRLIELMQARRLQQRRFAPFERRRFDHPAVRRFVQLSRVDARPPHCPAAGADRRQRRVFRSRRLQPHAARPPHS